jgi:hypothetical protein
MPGPAGEARILVCLPLSKNTDRSFLMTIPYRVKNGSDI